MRRHPALRAVAALALAVALGTAAAATQPGPSASVPPVAGEAGAPPSPGPAVAATAVGDVDSRPLVVESALWLLPADRQAALARLGATERAAAALALLATDPLPATPANELAEGADRRRRLALAEALTPFDDRVRALFVLGRPAARQTIDCDTVFRPLELWRYPDRELVLFQPAPGRPWRLWSPARGKGELYTEQARSWMEEWHDARGRSRERLDRRFCPQARLVDRLTGTDGLWPATDAPSGNTIAAIEAPADLAAWAAAALETPLAEGAVLPIAVRAVEMAGPRGSRTATRLVLELPAGAPLVPVAGESSSEVRLGVEGVVETGGEVLEEFRMRFPLPPPAAGEALPLVVERALRAGHYTVRLRVTDEVGGASAVLAQAVTVTAVPPAPPSADAAASERLEARLDHAAHAVALLAPPEDVIFGNVRVQAVAVGPRVHEVAFLVDGVEQLRSTTRPYSVSVVLPAVPREVTLRAEARDAAGAVLAFDEIAVNRPRGALRVELAVSPVAGAERVRAQVAVTVPPERRLESVSVRVNEGEPVALAPPGYTAELELPADEVVFVTATAVLDDGNRVEAVEVVRDPWGGEAVDVELVELLTTLVDRSGALVDSVSAAELSVWEEGRRQAVQRVIPAGDLPLTVGVAIDVSGSMRTSLRQAQQAAVDFLGGVVGPNDRAFAVAFSARPQLVMPPTPDVGAVRDALENTTAEGWTALHDGIVFGLYHLRAVRGRRALVVLSDGDDTKSQVDYATALEHARASGVVIYSIGLATPTLDPTARRALRSFAEETGGRAFFVRQADELAGIYGEIAEELRRQLLIAYAPDRPGPEALHRAVEVRVDRPGVRVRSVRGYAR